MKKLIVSFVIVAMLSLAFSMPVSAHHGNGGGNQTTVHPRCTVEKCQEIGIHVHGGKSYCTNLDNCTKDSECQIHENCGSNNTQSGRGHGNGRHCNR